MSGVASPVARAVVQPVASSVVGDVGDGFQFQLGGLRVTQTPPPPTAVSGITFTHWWDFGYGESDRIYNAVDSSKPLKYSAATNADQPIPPKPPSGRPADITSLNLAAPEFTCNLRDFGLVFVGRWDTTAESDAVSINNGLFYLRGGGTAASLAKLSDYGTGFAVSAPAATNQWAVYVVRVINGQIFIWCNQRGAGSTTSLPTAGTATSLCVLGPVGFRGCIAALGSFTMTGTISNAQVAAISRQCYSRWLVPAQSKRVFLDGNSQVSGAGLRYDQSRVHQLGLLLGSSWGITSLAVPNSVAPSELDSYAAEKIDPWATRASDVLIFNEISNELAGGASAATALTSLKSYVANRRSAGVVGPIILHDCCRWRSEDITTAADSINASLAADFATATGNARVFAGSEAWNVDCFLIQDSEQTLLAASDSGGIQADGVHYTAALQAAVAADEYDAIAESGV